MAGGLFVYAQAENAKEASAPKAADENAVVAKVNGTEIRQSDVNAFIETLGARAKGVPAEMLQPMIVQQLVDMQVIDEKLAEKNLASDPEVMQILDRARKDIMRNVFIRREAEARITDDMMQKKHAEMKAEGKQVHARHILVKDEATAKDIIAKIEKGEKFEDLAKAHSLDGTKDKGGDLGFFSKGQMVPEFADAAFALKDKEVTKAPVKTQFGYHVIETLERKDAEIPAFDAMKDDLRNMMMQEEGNKVIEDLKAKAKIEIVGDGKAAPVGIAVPATEEKKEEPKAVEAK